METELHDKIRDIIRNLPKDQLSPKGIKNALVNELPGFSLKSYDDSFEYKIINPETREIECTFILTNN